jgi:hypothetical protein
MRHLQGFSLHDSGATIGKHTKDPVVESGCEIEQPDEHEVADEKGQAIPLLGIHRWLAAPQLTVVIDVIVDEGRGMQQLNSRGQGHCLRGVLTTRSLVREQYNPWPDPLASRIENVLTGLREKTHVACDGSSKCIFQQTQLFGNDYARPHATHRHKNLAMT